MSCPKIRADYDQLQQIAGQFAQQADACQRTLRNLTSTMGVLEHGDWQGQGARAFYQEMNAEVLPTMRRLTKALESAGHVTSRISAVMKAGEDEAASYLRAVGSGGAAGPGMGAAAAALGGAGGAAMAAAAGLGGVAAGVAGTAMGVAGAAISGARAATDTALFAVVSNVLDAARSAAATDLGSGAADLIRSAQAMADGGVSTLVPLAINLLNQALPSALQSLQSVSLGEMAGAFKSIGTSLLQTASGGLGQSDPEWMGRLADMAADASGAIPFVGPILGALGSAGFGSVAEQLGQRLADSAGQLGGAAGAVLGSADLSAGDKLFAFSASLLGQGGGPAAALEAGLQSFVGNALNTGALGPAAAAFGGGLRVLEGAAQSFASPEALPGLMQQIGGAQQQLAQLNFGGLAQQLGDGSVRFLGTTPAAIGQAAVQHLAAYAGGGQVSAIPIPIPYPASGGQVSDLPGPLPYPALGGPINFYIVPSIGDDAQRANVELQNSIRQAQQTLSQVSKMSHEAAMSILANLRS